MEPLFPRVFRPTVQIVAPRGTFYSGCSLRRLCIVQFRKIVATVLSFGSRLRLAAPNTGAGKRRTGKKALGKCSSGKKIWTQAYKVGNISDGWQEDDRISLAEGENFKKKI